jgi:hypothetical protein
MISGPSSYLTTLDEFLAHWTAVNADPLAGTGLVTRDGATRANLASLHTELGSANNAVESGLNGKEIDRALVENAKRALLLRSQELGRRLRGVLPVDSPYLKAMPELPAQTSAQENFLKPMRDLANLWVRVEAAGSVFELADSYDKARYQEDLDDLTGLYTNLGKTVLDLKLAREKRNTLQEAAKKILSAYRPAVEGLFPPDSPLVNTLPLLYPAAGRTPEPVTATASFDAAAGEAVVTFTEAAEPNLESYELRGVPGPEYDGEDEVVLARLDKTAPRSFRSAFSLAQPGTAASFKVYVILSTGNEAGSNPVTVERP